MVKHSYPGTEFTGKTERKIPGLPGWFLVGNTKVGGFAILAKAGHGEGFSSRDKARAARKELTV